ncbi:hypothetical protein SH528x_003016 [Novipirellula sp. SH528]|uniref:hypothetical protein n=1 Tax=Novipirellula sp. SH528 TaxID=3454466 RepID=UPI003FA03394
MVDVKPPPRGEPRHEPALTMVRLQEDTPLRDPGYGERSGNRNVALESMGVSGVVDVGHESHKFARIGLLGFGFVLIRAIRG